VTPVLDRQPRAAPPGLSREISRVQSAGADRDISVGVSRGMRQGDHLHKQNLVVNPHAITSGFAGRIACQFRTWRYMRNRTCP